MEVYISDGLLVTLWVVLGVLITKICVVGFPKYLELSLLLTIAHPVETHVHGL